MKNNGLGFIEEWDFYIQKMNTKKWTQSIRDLWAIPKFNICIIILPEEKKSVVKKTSKLCESDEFTNLRSSENLKQY